MKTELTSTDNPTKPTKPDEATPHLLLNVK